MNDYLHLTKLEESKCFSARRREGSRENGNARNPILPTNSATMMKHTVNRIVVILTESLTD